MKAYLFPLVGALIAFSIVFFALDFSIMKLQGLTLVYHH
jgi:uncharacterized membrane protein